ncbi:hypothetical protein PMIN07_006488 [Paraphaeosphaeria minitans]
MSLSALETSWLKVASWANSKDNREDCPPEQLPPTLDWVKDYEFEDQETVTSGIETSIEAVPPPRRSLISKCELSWSGIAEFLKVLIGEVERDECSKHERDGMIKALDKRVVRLINCPGCSTYRFLEFANNHPEYNKLALIYDFLRNPKIFCGGIKCIPELQTSVASSDLEENGFAPDVPTHQRRVIDPDLDLRNDGLTLPDPIQRPTFGRVMRAILSGALSLHYARWALYTPAGTPRPGWIVIHVHLDDSDVMRPYMLQEQPTPLHENPRLETLRTFVHMSAITVFHAQAWSPRQDQNGNDFTW